MKTEHFTQYSCVTIFMYFYAVSLATCANTKLFWNQLWLQWKHVRVFVKLTPADVFWAVGLGCGSFALCSWPVCRAPVKRESKTITAGEIYNALTTQIIISLDLNKKIIKNNKIKKRLKLTTFTTINRFFTLVFLYFIHFYGIICYIDFGFDKHENTFLMINAG